MKRLFALCLLLGAMIGLFGQEMAFASGVRIATPTAQSEAMPGCAMPMVERKHDKTCKGLTLACIAAMGCAIALADADAPAGIGPLHAARIAPVAAATKRLTGLRVLPEPEPPHRPI